MLEQIAVERETVLPFPGLRSFSQSESELFFGREGQCDDLAGKLGKSRFIAVVGTSGSGKSSLVRAGLLPSLESGNLAKAGSHWRVVDMRPGSHAIENLAEALNRAAISQTPVNRDRLMESSLALLDIARSAHDSGRLERHENLLILVDQFEELFRFKARDTSMCDRDEQAAFLKLLLKASGQREMPIYVVITMRSDFLGDCARFRDLPEAINSGQYLVPRMTRDERREAIEGPVHMAGGTITPRLVQRILNDVGEDPDQLPVMQHALMRTWLRWSEQENRGTSVDVEDFEDAGTLEDALSVDADQAYLEACAKVPERGHEIVKRIFQRLRERDPGSREVRRPTSFRELCAVTEARPEQVLAVLECFRRESRSFLMPPLSVPLSADREIDVTHESLLRQWKRLHGPVSDDAGWLTEEEESRRTLLRLVDRAEQQVQGKPDYLRGPLLQLALDWWTKRRPNQAWAERYTTGFENADRFLRESQTEGERELEREAKQRAEQEAARLQAARGEEELKAKRLKLRMAYLFAALIVIGAVASIFASLYVTQQQQRVKEAKEATERLRSQQSQEISTMQMEAAEEAAREAKRDKKKAEDSAATAQSLQKQAKIQLLASKAALVGTGSASMLPVSMLLAAESMRRQPLIDSDAILSEGLPLLPQPLAPLPKFSVVESALFSANGMLATSEPDSVRVWDLAARRLVTNFDVIGSPEAIAISDDAELIAIAMGDSKQSILQIFNVKTHAVVARHVTEPGVRYLRLGKNGFLLAVIGGAIQYWNDRTDERGYRPAPEDELSNWGAAAFHSDGMLLALFHADKPNIDVYSLPSRRVALSFSRSDEPVMDLAFDPMDKSRLATLNTNGTIKVWTLNFQSGKAQLNTSFQFGQTAEPVRGHSEIGFSNDGRFLIVNQGTGVVRIWDTQDSKAGAREAARVFPSKDQAVSVAVEGAHRFIVLAQKGLSHAWQMPFVPLPKSIAAADISEERAITILREASGNSAIWDNAASIWREADFARLAKTMAVNTSHYLAAGISQDKRSVQVVRFDGSRSDKIVSLPIPIASTVSTLQFCADGRWLGGNVRRRAETGFENGVTLWNVSDPSRPPATIMVPHKNVTLIGYLPEPDQRAILRITTSATSEATTTQNAPGAITLWELYGQKSKSMSEGAFKQDVSGLKFSPNGKVLATTVLNQSTSGGKRSNAVTVWRWPENKPIGRPLETDTAATLVAFSSDRRYLATSGGEGFIRVWNIASGEEVGRVSGRPVGMSFVDGDRRILSFETEYVLKSPWRAADLLQETCERIGRSLSSDEWGKYLGDEKRVQTCGAFNDGGN